MHYEAYQYLLSRMPDDSPALKVLEIGSRDINGSPREFFNEAQYYGIDIAPGNGVDEVTDGAKYNGKGAFDVVICAETLEHADNPRGIINAMIRSAKPGGLLLITAAAPDRIPHSAIDGGELRAGEHYRNIDPDILRDWLIDCGAIRIDVQHNGIAHDVYASAIKPPDPEVFPDESPADDPHEVKPKRGRKRAS